MKPSGHKVIINFNENLPRWFASVHN